MQNKSILLGLCAFILLSGCAEKATNNSLQTAEQNGTITKSELQEMGISVAQEAQVELHPRELLDAPGYNGFFIVHYGDPSPLFYTVYVYDQPDSALAQYSERKQLLAQMADRIIDQRADFHPYTLVATKNTAGKENLVLLYNYEKYVLLLMATSEMETQSPGFDDEKFVSIANKVIEKMTGGSPN